MTILVLGYVINMPHQMSHTTKQFYNNGSSLPLLGSATNVSDPTSTKELWCDVVKCHFVMPSDTAYGGHAVLLFAALYATDGAVLELGSGLFSTPIIHNVAVVQQGRDVFTVDADSDWLQQFTAMGGPHHSFGLVSPEYSNESFRYLQFKPAHFQDWEDVWEQMYGLVFVDQAPAFERRKDIQRRRNASDVMVVHDTDTMEFYDYEPLLSTFPYRYKFRHNAIKTYTDVISDRRGDLIDKTRILSEWTCECLGLEHPRLVFL